MTLNKKGKIVDCLEIPPTINPETKELRKGSYMVQALVTEKMKNGVVKKDIIDIKIDESRFKEYQSKIGKEEEFEVSLYSNTPIYLTAV